MTEYTFSCVFSRFMKPIHVELSDEGVNLTVTEIFRQNDIFKLINVLNHKFMAGGSPKNYFIELGVLHKKTIIRIESHRFW